MTDIQPRSYSYNRAYAVTGHAMWQAGDVNELAERIRDAREWLRNHPLEEIRDDEERLGQWDAYNDAVDCLELALEAKQWPIPSCDRADRSPQTV